MLLKAKPRKGMRNFFELMLWCGISTTIWGAITGGLFSDAPLQIAQIINPDTTWTGLPALFTPLNDTIMILIGAMCLGFVQIITGMIINVVIKVKRGEIFSAVFEEGTWFVLFIGIACLALGVGNIAGVPVVIVIGAVMLFIGSAKGKKGFGIITGFIGAIYNGVTGYFGDILSYSRLMALMLAGSVIAQVFNTIGAIAGNIFVFLLDIPRGQRAELRAQPARLLRPRPAAPVPGVLRQVLRGRRQAVQAARNQHQVRKRHQRQIRGGKQNVS